MNELIFNTGNTCWNIDEWVKYDGTLSDCFVNQTLQLLPAIVLGVFGPFVLFSLAGTQIVYKRSRRWFEMVTLVSLTHWR